jgi:hypothetical protein
MNIVDAAKELINEVRTIDNEFVIVSERHVEDLIIDDNKYSIFLSVRPDSLIDLPTKKELDDKKLVAAYNQLKESNQLQSIPIQNFVDKDGHQKNLSIELKDFDVKPSEL